MKFGLMTQLQLPRPWTETSEREAFWNCIDQAVAGEQAGFSNFWITEQHFFEEIGHCPTPEMVLAAISQRTTTMRLGFSVILVPLHNPFFVAERVATLDILSNGRCEFGAGRGTTNYVVEGLNFDPAKGRDMGREAMDAILSMFENHLFPGYKGEYYDLTHITLPKKHLVFVEAIVGDIEQLKNQRAWISCMPIPFMEVEAAWARVVAFQPPAYIKEDEFLAEMAKAEMLDLTVPFSVQTPQWLNYIPLSVTYTKRVGGQYFGMGRNGSICNASIHLGTHMDGEKHFYPNGRTIGQVPLEEWVGPGVIADISELVSDSSVYTPEMIEKVVDIHKGDILIIKTGWNKFGWNSPESDEFRYMVKHPGPSPDFSKWATEMQIKWIGVDAVSADHPMNTIMRLWHPKTFEEANRKLIKDFGKDWDQMYPLDKFYQDMHFNLFSKHIVHAENLSGAMLTAKSGRYYIGCYLQKAMEAESMWGRFVAFKEG